MTNKHEQGKEGPWWEKLTDASSDSTKSKSLITKALVVGIIVMAGILGWKFLQSKSESNQDELAKALFDAGSFLPDSEGVNFGRIPDLMSMRTGRPSTMASAYFREHESGVVEAGNPLRILMDPEGAATYVNAAEGAIAKLGDQKSKFTDPEWELKYLFTMQQLHYFAAINSADVARRNQHLDKQLEILKDLDARFADKGILAIKPYEKSPATILELWKDAEAKARKSGDVLAKSGKLEVMPDSKVVVTIELENGQILKMNTFSEVSTKTVQNFLSHVRAGLYDGIAVHRLDRDAGVLELGSPWSREAADRKFLWGREVPGYKVQQESTPLLKVKRGSVTTKADGQMGHGLFFEIHLSEPDRVNPAQTVIGEITEGLDALDAWLATDVHDEVGVADRLLPRTRLGVKSIKVEGEVDQKGEDSWKPTLADLKVPAEVNALEKQFEEALKPKDDTNGEPKDGENSPEEDK